MKEERKTVKHEEVGQRRHEAYLRNHFLVERDRIRKKTQKGLCQSSNVDALLLLLNAELFNTGLLAYLLTKYIQLIRMPAEGAAKLNNLFVKTCLPQKSRDITEVAIGHRTNLTLRNITIKESRVIYHQGAVTLTYSMDIYRYDVIVKNCLRNKNCALVATYLLTSSEISLSYRRGSDSLSSLMRLSRSKFNLSISPGSVIFSIIAS